jgi:hypothetical protein
MQHVLVVGAGGIPAALAIGLLVVNLWEPPSAVARGVPVTGLRFAVARFVLTARFGAGDVADRRRELVRPAATWCSPAR